MSYTVLARRYRSETFDQVVGQEQVAQTLKKAISTGRIAHAYLFCGTRGVGKTSMARILAKALNCESFDQPTTTPCDHCNSCQAIARGDDIDVIEIDAASNTGVDNIRDLIENSQYRPARSRMKVYIIDEVHMLSKQAFNALLKTLEEPPEHVKFILATTEPEKVLPTILSRCQRYDFRNIPTREIAGHLKDICRKENIQADEEALMLVAKSGAGSMRDALSLLDRLLSIGETRLTSDMVERLLGLPKSQLLFDLAQAIASGDTKAVLHQSDAMITASLSPEMLIAALVDHLRNLLIFNACGGATDLIEVPGLSLAQIKSQAGRFDTATLSQDIIILEELRRTVRTTQAGRALLDATLVRLTLADQFASISELLDRLDHAPAVPDQKKKFESSVASAPNTPAPTTQTPPASTGQPSTAPAQSTPNTAESALPGPSQPATASTTTQSSTAAPADNIPPTIDLNDDDDDDDDLPSVGKVWEGSSGTSALLKPRETPRSGTASPSAARNTPPSPQRTPIDPANPASVWPALLAELIENHASLYGLLSSAHYAGLDQNIAVIQFQPAHESNIKLLDRNGKHQQVEETLSNLLNQRVGVRFEISQDAAPTIDASSQPSQHSAPTSPAADHPGDAASSRTTIAPPPTGPASLPLTQELLTELGQDPLIHTLLHDFGGNIIKVTEN